MAQHEQNVGDAHKKIAKIRIVIKKKAKAAKKAIKGKAKYLNILLAKSDIDLFKP